jgi:endonuclease YncB( thermonuclease family)
MRKKLVGKEVAFRVDYTIPATGREFGTVVVAGENVAHALLQAGLVRVREGKSGKYVVPSFLCARPMAVSDVRWSVRGRDDLSELQALEKEAKEAGRGVHGDPAGAVRGPCASRTPPFFPSDKHDDVGGAGGARGQAAGRRCARLPGPPQGQGAGWYAPATYQRRMHPRGPHQARRERAAVVERVRDGATLQLTLLPSLQPVTVLLSGVKCPVYRKDVPDQPDVIEPFAAEVRAQPRINEAPAPRCTGCAGHLRLTRHWVSTCTGQDVYRGAPAAAGRAGDAGGREWPRDGGQCAAPTRQHCRGARARGPGQGG